MAQTDKTYLNEMQKQWGYFAAWPPNKCFKLGDYGDLQGDEFEQLGAISKWVTPKPSSKPGGSMYYVSAGDVSVDVDFGVADKTGQAAVDVKIHFDKKSSIFFLAQNTTIVSTQNLEQVGDKIVDVYKEKGNAWELRYSWITTLVEAEHLTVLIALDSNVSVTLSGKAPITYQGVPVANLDLRNFTLTKGLSSVSHFQSDDLTPLFNLYEVKNPITRKPYYTECR